MRRLLFCALASLAAPACDRDTGPGIVRDAVPETADVTVALHPYFRDLRVVRAQAGADTLTLLFDSGGGATLIAPHVARARGCTPHGADVGHRMSGEPVTFGRCDSLRIDLGGWSTRLAPVAVFDVNALLPKELPRLDGVLALDAFRGHALTIDWPAGAIIIRGTAAVDSAIASTGIAIRLATGESGRFLSALVRVGGTHEPLWFLLDSGNLRGTLVSTTVLQDSLLPLRSPNEALLSLGGRAPVPSPFTPAELMLDGALGTDFLQQGPVTLDLRRAAQ